MKCLFNFVVFLLKLPFKIVFIGLPLLDKQVAHEVRVIETENENYDNMIRLSDEFYKLHSMNNDGIFNVSLIRIYEEIKNKHNSRGVSFKDILYGEPKINFNEIKNKIKEINNQRTRYFKFTENGITSEYAKYDGYLHGDYTYKSDDRNVHCHFEHGLISGFFQIENANKKIHVSGNIDSGSVKLQWIDLHADVYFCMEEKESKYRSKSGIDCSISSNTTKENYLFKGEFQLNEHFISLVFCKKPNYSTGDSSFKYNNTESKSKLSCGGTLNIFYKIKFAFKVAFTPSIWGELQSHEFSLLTDLTNSHLLRFEMMKKMGFFLLRRHKQFDINVELYSKK